MKRHYDPPAIELLAVRLDDILTASNDLEDEENPFELKLD